MPASFICPLCEQTEEAIPDLDIAVRFYQGGCWQMPAGIIHHIQEHGFVPPPKFINDVMRGRIMSVFADLPRSTSGFHTPHPNFFGAENIGYFGDKEKGGRAPDHWLEKLKRLIRRRKNPPELAERLAVIINSAVAQRLNPGLASKQTLGR